MSKKTTTKELIEIANKITVEMVRELTGFLVQLVESTLNDGAWDEENKCIK